MFSRADHRHHRAVAVAVAGDVGDAGGDRPARVEAADGLAADLERRHLARAWRRRASPASSSRPEPRTPETPRISPACRSRSSEAIVAPDDARGRAAPASPDRARDRLRIGVDDLAGDQPHQVVVVVAAARHVGDQPAVAQDDDAVGKLDHLVEAVGDEDHPGAARRRPRRTATKSLSTSSPCREAVGSSRTSTLLGCSQPSSARRDRDDRPLGGAQLVDRRARRRTGRRSRRSAPRPGAVRRASARAAATARPSSSAEVEVLDRGEACRPGRGPGG